MPFKASEKICIREWKACCFWKLKMEAKVVRMNPVNTWLAAASVALLVSLGFSVYMFNQKNKFRSKRPLPSISEKYINSAQRER